MLGRLQMSIDQCIQVYSKMSEDIFTAKIRILGKKVDALRGKPWFDAAKLEVALRKVTKTHCGDETASLINSTDINPKCKV